MMDRLFICGTDPEAGSSVVALGLYGVLSRSVSKVGFFKPVGGGSDDQDVAVMKTAFGLAREPGELCPVILDDARELMGDQQQDELLKRVARPWACISRDGEFVLVEGINNQPAMNLFDMDINVAIAGHLRAPVLLVARGSQSGGNTDVDQLVATVMKTSRAFAVQDIDILGVVVNRVEDRPTDELNKRLADAFQRAEIPYFGLLPSLGYLAHPKLDQIAKELNARILADEAGLDVAATNTLVAAMEPRHFLKYVKGSGTLVIVPGDRENILLTLACLQTTPTRGSMSGVVLTGGLEPDPEILSLIEDMHLPNLPVMLVDTDTYTTVNRIRSVSARIRPQDRDKINAALSDVAAHLAHERIREALEMPRKPRRAMGSDAFLDELIDIARATQKRIVLPEGEEPRTLRAAQRVLELGICPLTLLGAPDRIREVAMREDVRLDGNVDFIDPGQSPRIDEYVDTIVEMRKGKRGGITHEVARQWLLESPIHFGTLMVKHDHAAGLVAGAIHATRDTIRPAFQIIRVSPTAGIASSVFFMALKDRVLVYGDCAIIPNPTAEELARIAISSARTARAFGIRPRVAMLSYSTGRSGAGESVDKVTEATRMVKDMKPDFAIDGPLQYDAAIDPDVGRLKQPDSPVAGQANVFVFPDLDAGNIAYKAVQRSAGAIAVGPVMQGLNKPVNDLSRGCTVDDIVYTIAVTAIQAGSKTPG